MDNSDARYIIIMRLVIGFLVSLIGLVLLEPYKQNFLIDLTLKGLEAAAIACVIGIFIDIALKQNLVRDVFLTSVGYVLPPELRPEMQWLCTLDEMCIGDAMICTLTPVGGSVKLHVHRTQIVKNVSCKKNELKVGLGIDEWFRQEGESRILKFSFVTDDQGWSYRDHPRISDFGMNLPEDVPIVVLRENQTVTIVSEFEEIYPRNGYYFMHIKYATSGARVSVNCHDQTLGHYVQFSSRSADDKVQEVANNYGGEYVCPDTLLPYQRIAIRFWDKPQSDARRRRWEQQ